MLIHRVLFAACLTLVVAKPAAAQWRVGGFVGGEHDSSWDEFLVIGADARGAVGSNGMELNPRISYFLRNRTTRFQIDVNVIKPLILAEKSRVTPFVGIGLALENVSYDSPNSPSEANFGFNYIVGGTLRVTGSLQPYAQFAYSVLKDAPNTAVLSVGVHYTLKSGK